MVKQKQTVDVWVQRSLCGWCKKMGKKGKEELLAVTKKSKKLVGRGRITFVGQFLSLTSLPHDHVGGAR